MIPSLDWWKRENLQETHGFLPSNIGLSCKFSHHLYESQVRIEDLAMGEIH
jgi:hypothetical protein